MNNRKIKLAKRITASVLFLGCGFMTLERIITKMILDSYFSETDHSVFYYIASVYAILSVYFLFAAIKGAFLLGFKRDK